MTFRDCAAQAWRELGWSEEKIQAAIKARDGNAAVLVHVTHKEVPPELEREAIDFFKNLELQPEEEKKRQRAIARKVVKQEEAKLNNN